MISYELAKQLNDAGFRSISREFVKPDGGYYDWSDMVTGGERVPTLSELIEACGDSFRHLTLHHLSPKKPHFMEKHGEDMVWSAHSCAHFVSKKHKGRVHRGQTPEEAVANLWLALNK